jgi:radical SAM superfamily enzyme YgiQ (UPF0313 family)
LKTRTKLLDAVVFSGGEPLVQNGLETAIKQVKELGFKKFLLIDDNILSDRKYMMDLCAEIKKLKMEWYSQCSIHLANDDELLKCVVDSGCTTLSFGIETITKSNLQKLNKDWEDPAEYSRLIQKLRNAGIDVATEMMLGLEDDTVESIKETAKFIIDNKVEAPKFYILCPVPGTPYYEEVKDSPDLVNHDIYTYSPNKATKNTPNLSAEEIDKLYWELYNEVYNFFNENEYLDLINVRVINYVENKKEMLIEFKQY